MYCVQFAAHPCPQVPIEGFEASFATQRICFPCFGCLREPIVVEGECKLCSVKLEKGCKTLDNIVSMARCFMLSNRL